MGVIQGRADQVVHAGVDDQECLGVAMLDIDHARHQHAGIGGDQAARLEDQAAAQVPGQPRDHRAIGGGIGRRRVVVLVGHAQPAAQIQARRWCGRRRARSATSSATRLKAASNGSRSVIWLPIWTSMPTISMLLQLGGMRIGFARTAEGNAELGFRRAGGDLGVGLGVHIGIDAQW